MWPFVHKHWVFQPPPCICAEIEAHVRDACALRDEMATWATPLEEWKKLQETQVLMPKGQPKPFVDTWGDTYQAVMHSIQINTATRIGVPMYLPMRKPWQQLPARVCYHCGSPDYHWTDGTELYCNSCWSTRPSWR